MGLKRETFVSQVLIFCVCMCILPSYTICFQCFTVGILDAILDCEVELLKLLCLVVVVVVTTTLELPLTTLSSEPTGEGVEVEVWC